MATEQVVAPTNADRIGRIRSGHALHSDMDWLRIVPRDWGPSRYICDCRCRCHGGPAPTATGGAAGSCGLMIDLDALDCGRACRSAHILASECQMDETR